MIQPLDLLWYIAITVILSAAIGAYIGVALILSGKVYSSIVERTWGHSSGSVALCVILTFIVLLSPLAGMMIYFASLTADN